MIKFYAPADQWDSVIRDYLHLLRTYFRVWSQHPGWLRSWGLQWCAAATWTGAWKLTAFFRRKATISSPTALGKWLRFSFCRKLSQIYLNLVSNFYSFKCQQIPGESERKPNTYPFGTTYDHIFADLTAKDKELYTKNGMLHIMERNRRIKVHQEFNSVQWD